MYIKQQDVQFIQLYLQYTQQHSLQNKAKKHIIHTSYIQISYASPTNNFFSLIKTRAMCVVQDSNNITYNYSSGKNAKCSQYTLTTFTQNPQTPHHHCPPQRAASGTSHSAPSGHLTR